MAEKFSQQTIVKHMLRESYEQTVYLGYLHIEEEKKKATTLSSFMDRAIRLQQQQQQ